MLVAMLKIMWLRLWRDKGALTLAFILPGFIFAIFAAIFSNAAGGNLNLRVSMAVTDTSPATLTYANTVRDSAGFSLSYKDNWTAADIQQRVRLGQDDVGFVITGDIGDLSSPPVMIISDPSRAVAATILKGELQKIWAGQIGNTQPEFFVDTLALTPNDRTGPSDQSVTYYIGATAMLFLLFSAMQGAALSLDERKSGISDRLLIGVKGALSMLTGKFIFLTLIGALQAAIIVGVAHTFFEVGITDNILALMLACIGAAALSAAIALLVASLCESAAQMHTVSTFVVLLFSAIGGSMVPRFMMPEWLQSIGVFTPNHWAIDAFYGTLARGQTLTDLWPAWSVLFGGALICLLAAAIISHKFMRT